MERYNLNGTFFYCPVDLTLSVIGGRWKGLIIWNLKEQSKRFNELKRTLVTINDKMLSQSLKDLVEHGVVNRKSYNTIPPKVEYSLTKEGEKILPIMQQMNDWGKKYKAD
ncbi:MAG: helix-turn-helix transcriptional regulator [Bacteroidales bacterium]|nr:helix-turn-helix transcriptional regulator [Bacteroidales bacterium]